MTFADFDSVGIFGRFHKASACFGNLSPCLRCAFPNDPNGFRGMCEADRSAGRGAVPGMVLSTNIPQVRAKGPER